MLKISTLAYVWENLIQSLLCNYVVNISQSLVGVLYKVKIVP